MNPDNHPDDVIELEQGAVGGDVPRVLGPDEELASDGETVRPKRVRQEPPPPLRQENRPKRNTRRKPPRPEGVQGKHAKHSRLNVSTQIYM